MEERLLKIINNFGVNNQQRKLQEELFELQEAITLFEAGKGDIKNVIEEIADVEVLLDQFKELYEIKYTELFEVKVDKIRRTLERIESGYYERNNQ